MDSSLKPGGKYFELIKKRCGLEESVQYMIGNLALRYSEKDNRLYVFEEEEDFSTQLTIEKILNLIMRSRNQSKGGVKHIREQLDEISAIQNTPLLNRVKGQSNFQSKLLGTMMTYKKLAKDVEDFGRTDSMDEHEKGHLTFDHIHSAWHYVISVDKLRQPGFGEDERALKHLGDVVEKLGGRQEKRNLAVLYTDGDGHCLVHAISKCLVGTEILWHALRTDLHHRLKTDKELYLSKLKNHDFGDQWNQIVTEAHPDYNPRDYPKGLSPIHLFGLANIMKRPIVLLDQLGANREAGLYLPVLHLPSKCRTKKVIIVAWGGADHYVSVVPIEGREAILPLSCIPGNGSLPNVWGFFDNDEELIRDYVDIKVKSDGTRYLEVGGDSIPKIDTITKRLDDEFKKEYQVTTGFVSEVMKALMSIPYFREIINSSTPEGLTNLAIPFKDSLFYCAECTRNKLRGIDDDDDFYDLKCHHPSLRKYCMQKDRFNYEIGDRLPSKSTPGLGCCGYKHFHLDLEKNVKEVDYHPHPIDFGTTIVYWVQDDGDSNNHTNAYDVAQYLISNGHIDKGVPIGEIVNYVLSKASKIREIHENRTNQHSVFDASKIGVSNVPQIAHENIEPVVLPPKTRITKPIDSPPSRRSSDGDNKVVAQTNNSLQEQKKGTSPLASSKIRFECGQLKFEKEFDQNETIEDIWNFINQNIGTERFVMREQRIIPRSNKTLKVANLLGRIRIVVDILPPEED